MTTQEHVTPFRRANAFRVAEEHAAEVRDLEAQVYRDLAAKCAPQIPYIESGSADYHLTGSL